MKRKIIYLTIAAIAAMPALLRAQNVGINTDNTAPAPSAMLDVKSTNKGLLIPRMTTTERTAIAAPANGLMVYDITTNSFWFFKNTTWTEVTGGLTLPYSGTNSTPNSAFAITNTNGGNFAYAVAGTAKGKSTAIIGTADSSGSGLEGHSLNGSGVVGYSANGRGGEFITEGSAHAVYGSSQYGRGGSFESNDGDSAAVYGLADGGPGGEFKSITGPAVKARGSVDILKNRLRFAGNMANGNAHGIEFSNNAGTTMSHFYGMLNDSISGFYGNNAWRLNFNNTNGNLGLQGNSNPRAPLSFASSAGNKIALYGDGGTEHYGIGIGNGTIQIYGPTTGADVVMGYGNSTNFTERMRVKGTGNVGIGTATPTEKLHVVGNTRATGTAKALDFTTDAGSILGEGLSVVGSANVGGNVTATFSVNSNQVNTANLKVTGGAPTVGAVLMATNTAGDAAWTNNRIGFSATMPIGIPSTANYYATNCYEEYDGSNNFDPVTGIFTAPKAGLYHFDIHFLVQNLSSTYTDIQCKLICNNQSVGNRTSWTNVDYNNGGAVSLSTNLMLSAGDQLSASVHSGSGGGLFLITSHNYFGSGVISNFSGYLVH